MPLILRLNAPNSIAKCCKYLKLASAKYFKPAGRLEFLLPLFHNKIGGDTVTVFGLL
jgi:hypothetical protein